MHAPLAYLNAAGTTDLQTPSCCDAYWSLMHGSPATGDVIANQAYRRAGARGSGRASQIQGTDKTALAVEGK